MNADAIVLMNVYRISGTMHVFRNCSAVSVWYALDWYFDEAANA